MRHRTRRTGFGVTVDFRLIGGRLVLVLRIFGWICAVLVLFILFIFIPLQAIDRYARPCNLLSAFMFWSPIVPTSSLHISLIYLIPRARVAGSSHSLYIYIIYLTP